MTDACEGKESPKAMQALGVSYHQLGIVAQLRDDYDAAEGWYRQALSIFVQLGATTNSAKTRRALELLDEQRKSAASTQVPGLKKSAPSNEASPTQSGHEQGPSFEDPPVSENSPDTASTVLSSIARAVLTLLSVLVGVTVSALLVAAVNSYGSQELT